MNSTEVVQEDRARLVRELVVGAVDSAVHGVTFDGRRLVLAAGQRLVRLLADSGRAIDQLETFPDRGGLAYDGRHLWQCSEGRIQQLDPRTGFVLRSLSPQLVDITGLECFGEELLVLHAGGSAIARVETLNATRVAEVAVAAPLRGLAWLAQKLWSSTAGELCCIDPTSGRAVARYALPAGIEVCDLSGDGVGRLWCADGRSRVLREFVTGR